MKKIIPFTIIIIIPFIFFWQFFIKGLLPIPSDTIIGLYHPFRDLYSKDYPRGVPFKNFLITDPVRQQYPWKELAINIEKNWELPLWNPYSFSGAPLAANFQSAVFYPLNILFFILPFSFSWSLFILLAPILAGIFLYLYLQNLGLNKWASVLGSIAFSFSGFSVSWLEWGNILHTALWLPLILLSTDKMVSSIKHETSLRPELGARANIKDKKVLLWSFIFVFSLTSSFFAGHLQIFFYLFIFSIAYFLARWIQLGRRLEAFLLFVICYLLFVIVAAIQWFPTLRFIFLSGRNLDQIPWQNPGWFLPWQNLIQFIAPDFFGNPATLNYWGIFNYAEFVGYIGITPIILALFALFFRHDKKTLFFGTLFFLSLIFSLPTIFAKIPYLLRLSFIDTTQPTRLLFITDFCLAVLSAIGFDYFLKSENKKKIFYSSVVVGIIFFLLWGFTLFGNNITKFVTINNLSIARHNLIFPSLIFVSSLLLFCIFIFFSGKNKRISLVFCLIILALTALDLIRFGWKFTPFTKRGYLFPQTKSIEFLNKNLGNFRIMSTDSRIFPPNFSAIYKLQSVDGYDPLYLRRYGELIAASERGEPNISPPFGFNRIITPHNFESKIVDLLGVKYVLSISDILSPKLKKVFQEGETRVYENKDVLPRVFFVEQVLYEKDKNHTMNALFRDDIDLRKIAILQLPYQKDNAKLQPTVGQLDSKRTVGKATIISYSESRVIVDVENPSDSGFLILTDTYYPTWRARINSNYEIPILQVDYNFRGISIPAGKHKIEFYNSLF